MSEEKEVLAYVITHAGYDANDKPIKGGPYEGHGTYGQESRCLRNAMRWSDGARPLDSTLDAVRRVHPHARVIRIVRKARPSSGQEASAVEVLRELVAYDCVGFVHDSAAAGIRFGTIVDRARRVLAASGPDPSEVVRAALEELEAWEALDAASVAKGKASFFDNGSGSVAAQMRYEAAEAAWVSAAERHRTACAHRRKVTEEYRKAGGK